MSWKRKKFDKQPLIHLTPRKKNKNEKKNA